MDQYTRDLTASSSDGQTVGVGASHRAIYLEFIVAFNNDRYLECRQWGSGCNDRIPLAGARSECQSKRLTRGIGFLDCCSQCADPVSIATHPVARVCVSRVVRGIDGLRSTDMDTVVFHFTVECESTSTQSTSTTYPESDVFDVRISGDSAFRRFQDIDPVYNRSGGKNCFKRGLRQDTIIEDAIVIDVRVCVEESFPGDVNCQGDFSRAIYFK